MTHIAIIGECMIELNGAPFGNMHQSYGGDTLNAAIYLNRSAAASNPMSSNNTANPAIQTSYVTALGSDAISQEMLNRWQDEGLSTEFVLIDEQRSPGLYLIQLDNVGERTFLYWRNDSAARYMVQHPDFDKIANQLHDVDMVFLSGISLAILPHSDQLKLLTIIEGLRERGVTIAFDSNYRPKLWSSEAATKECYLLGYKTTDIALVTFDDEQLLWSDQTPQDTIRRLHALGVKIVVVKLGAEGCLISENPENDPVKVTTTPVETVVDSTSAGDSFNGGFLSCYLAGGSIEEACHQGNALARLVIQHHGAIIPKSITDTLSNPIKKQTMPTINDQLKALKVIPVIAIDNAEDIIPLGKVLAENGLPAAEITFRSDAAVEAIRLLREAQPDMLIGAGTILNGEQALAAKEAGATFVVSPGFNPNTVKACQEIGIDIIPGVNNPSTVEAALEMGLTTLKFFPAEASGGISMVKSLVGPYGDIRLMPTGGITSSNIDNYLAVPQVLACGGTWMVDKKLVENGEWDEIARLTREIVEQVNR